MKKAIYSFIYYRLLGWKTNVTVTNYDKCVICAAPHTTNLDLFIGKLFYGALGRKTSFMMKKEWFFFPLGLFFKAVGGIPVDRSRNFVGGSDGQTFQRMQKVSFGYHARRNPQGKSKLEKGFLLYRLESASTHRIDRYRLQQKDDFGNESHHAVGKY